MAVATQVAMDDIDITEHLTREEVLECAWGVVLELDGKNRAVTKLFKDLTEAKIEAHSLV